ncbi:MAG: DUF1616 domain-containing protein [Chloroflexota bacterium]|nr:MAG: DUF1616 domain-containing protein [Chloroflexota bacterium]
MSKLNKALSIFFIVAIVAALGSIIYIAVTPSENEKFTEFYILSAEGKAQDYPKQVTLGEPVEIVLGVINHEYETASYKVKIELGGIEASQVNIGTLANGEKWEDKVSFTPQFAGERQRVDFYIYKNSDEMPYLKEPLRLWVDVVSP